ncbi:hypothetical protein [Curtobacterium sp. MCSS17_016]|uniref:hypothetical protein n=1 Tax=Curtobacterium sp. MCSS17_016 TaxID=2175644 RepID=UPI000DAABFF6|nr:hypothetical protein [Curtobacterium sp. MCSS17_016]WIE81405.1 hypothetical protein DEJ19_019410 [Curtobacterium sp. MCSS17_016]
MVNLHLNKGPAQSGPTSNQSVKRRKLALPKRAPSIPDIIVGVAVLIAVAVGLFLGVSLVIGGSHGAGVGAPVGHYQCVDDYGQPLSDDRCDW